MAYSTCYSLGEVVNDGSPIVFQSGVAQCTFAVRDPAGPRGAFESVSRPPAEM